MFEAQADRTPDTIAVTLDDQTLSYRVLDERANQLAHRLSKLGVGEETCVGLYVERSLDMVIAMLGILKAGGIYVPLDPAYPPGRIDLMLGDTRAPVVVTQDHLARALAPGPATVLRVDRDRAAIAGESTARPANRTIEDNAAYVIFTSGSSGRPKGTTVTHRSVRNVVDWLQANYPLAPHDAVVQWITFAFDGSVCDFYWPFRAGARLVLLRPGEHREPDAVADVIARQRATTIILVPSMLASLIAHAKRHDQLRGLRQVFCGGETLTPELVARWSACMPTELVNLYGPTEATVFVSAWRCERDQAPASVPIGCPITDTQLHVLDDDLRPVAEGQTGELYIGGVGLARGYFEQPGLTAERFIPDPIGEPGSRLYRTGDLVRRRPDGAIEHLGRIDAQIKLRGFRIELGEIEAALRAQPGVRDAVVVHRDDAADDAALVGYVVADAGREVPIDALRTALLCSLPDYMVPSSLVALDALPLTPHGKVDRRALQVRPRPTADDGYAAPRSALEQVVTMIVAETLGVKRVGISDSFFRLGLSSLQATSIAHETSDALGVTVSVGQVFRRCTVIDLIDSLAPDAPQRARLERNAELLLELASAPDVTADTLDPAR